MTDPRLTRLTASLPATVPFVGPEAQERAMGRSFAARLGANENGFGPSPKVLESIAAAGHDAWMYGDPEAFVLREALASHHGVSMANVVCGVGIDGLLDSVVRMFVAPGDAVVTSDGAYPTFNFHVVGYGGVLHKVPFRDDHEDAEALVDRATEVGAKLVYLSNPDNPMGSWLSGDRIAAVLDRLPDTSLLVLDEAYVEFAPSEAIPDIPVDDPRAIRLRTFSKAYGLAGMRIGYALGESSLISTFDRVRNHYGLGRAAQSAALAALGDQVYLAEVLRRTARANDRIAGIGRANGLVPLPSATNFVTLDCGADGARARALVTALADRDVFVRMPFVAPQDRCIRISAGPDAELDVLEDRLPGALAAVLG